MKDQKQIKNTARNVARITWSAIGASVGIGVSLWCVGAPSAPLLLASLGGSTVFLFGLTSAPAAQPRALFGGHLGSAFIGIVCFQVFGDAFWVYVFAVVLALMFMLFTGTVHPPAGADPLIMIHGHAGFLGLWCPVGLGVTMLAMIAFLWSRILPGTYHYPLNWLEKSPPSIVRGSWRE